MPTLLLLILFLFLVMLAWGAWSFAPWVPTRSADIERILALAAPLKGKNFVELGSGDGRVTLAAAKEGAKATGYEIVFPLFLFAYIRALFTTLPDFAEANFAFGNFYNRSLSQADIVFLFGVPKTNAAQIRTKLEQELKPGAIVISYAFQIQGWEPLETSKPSQDDLPVYKYLWNS